MLVDLCGLQTCISGVMSQLVIHFASKVQIRRVQVCVSLHRFEPRSWEVHASGLPYSWLFPRALYFTYLLSLSISSPEVIFKNFAIDSISVILLKYFKVLILYFTNLVCTTKFLKYKSLENISSYTVFSPLSS